MGQQAKQRRLASRERWMDKLPRRRVRLSSRGLVFYLSPTPSFQKEGVHLLLPLMVRGGREEILDEFQKFLFLNYLYSQFLCFFGFAAGLATDHDIACGFGNERRGIAAV